MVQGILEFLANILSNVNLDVLANILTWVAGAAGIYLVLAIIVYFIPTILAIIRGGHFIIVFLINLFLGWTFIGWIVALGVGLVKK
jgi:hypothetical protein